MKLQLTINFVLASLMLISLESCSSAEETILKQPYLSHLNNTECISHPDVEALQSREDGVKGTFEMILEGSIATCKFTSLDYPCDFGKVNVNVLFKNGILTIVEFPSSDEADCRCETEASFSIMNIPDKDFILKIYHGNTTGKYNEDSPIYSGTVRIDDKSITIPY